MGLAALDIGRVRARRTSSSSSASGRFDGPRWALEWALCSMEHGACGRSLGLEIMRARLTLGQLSRERPSGSFVSAELWPANALGSLRHATSERSSHSAHCGVFAADSRQSSGEADQCSLWGGSLCSLAELGALCTRHLDCSTARLESSSRLRAASQPADCSAATSELFSGQLSRQAHKQEDERGERARPPNWRLEKSWGQDWIDNQSSSIGRKFTGLAWPSPKEASPEEREQLRGNWLDARLCGGHKRAASF